MTDTCATCISFLSQSNGSIGKCRLNPPTSYQWPNDVHSTDWCGQFSTIAARGSGAAVSVSVAANASNTFLFVVRADGTLWLSINNGSTWAQVTLP